MSKPSTQSEHVKSLLAYLFEDSQAEMELDETRAAIEHVLEQAEQQEPIQAERTPLVKALRALPLDFADTDLEYDPEGFSLSCAEERTYRHAVTLLMEPDAMERLARLGWVVTRCGDRAMSNEAPEFRIRFLEITTCDANDDSSWPAPNPDLIKQAIKKGREFATEPFDRDDANPVEDDEATDQQQAGVSQAKSGSDPEGKPKTGKSRSEAVNLANSLLSAPPLDEGAHKAGCACGFCKNKGRGFGKKKDAAAPDAAKAATVDPKQEEPPEPTFETLARRRGRPGTPPRDVPVAKAPKSSHKLSKAYRTPRT